MSNFFNLSIEKIRRDLRGLVVRFPVEMALCVIFTVIALMSGHDTSADELLAKSAFFPICLFVCLAVNFMTVERCRWIYYLSALVAVPVLALKMESYVLTYGYGFGLLLSFLLLFLCRTQVRDNRRFSANAVAVVIDLVMTGILMSIITAAVYAVLGSLVYLFGMDGDLLDYGFQWGPFLIGPMFFCLRQDSHQRQDAQMSAPAFVRFITKYIVSPAIIVYTLILYAYVVRALVLASLPLGGVAAMIMTYYIIAVAGRMLNELSEITAYGWFYRYLHWISLPILVLFWWGLVYRVNIYALTDSRVYLIAAGIVMVAVSVMMAVRRLDNYRLFAIIAVCAIAVLTYIPGISAKSIGIASQKARMERIADALDLRDAATGKLREHFNPADYDKDQLHELAEAYNYLRREMGQERLTALAGHFDTGRVLYRSDEEAITFTRDYNVALPLDRFRYYLGNAWEGGNSFFTYDGRIRLERSGRTILEAPIDSIELERAYNERSAPSEDVFVLSNDSIMLVIKSFERTTNGEWWTCGGQDCQVFSSVTTLPAGN